jgi:hypothetical protein
MEQNRDFFSYSDNQKIGTLMLSGQNLTKYAYGSLCPDINGSLPSGFLTYIRGSLILPLEKI